MTEVHRSRFPDLEEMFDRLIEGGRGYHEAVTKLKHALRDGSLWLFDFHVEPTQDEAQLIANAIEVLNAYSARLADAKVVLPMGQYEYFRDGKVVALREQFDKVFGLSSSTSDTLTELKPAPRSIIEAEITAVYGDAVKSNERPPNINELAALVARRLAGKHYKASGNQIKDIGRDPKFRSMRGPVGVTMKGRSGTDC